MNLVSELVMVVWVRRIMRACTSIHNNSVRPIANDVAYDASMKNSCVCYCTQVLTVYLVTLPNIDMQIPDCCVVSAIQIGYFGQYCSRVLRRMKE